MSNFSTFKNYFIPKIFLFLYFIVLPNIHSIYAQNFQNFQIVQEEDSLKIRYDISGGREKDLYKVDIKLSTDGGKNFNVIPKTAIGDLGYGISRGNNKYIFWEPLKDSIELTGDNIIFHINGEVLGTSPTIEFIKITGGEYEMGDAFEEGPTDENFKHKVKINDFEIGRFEITNLQYANFLNEYKSDMISDGEFADELMILSYDGGIKYFQGEWKPDLGYEYLPAIGVTWFGADEFCRYYNFRLPTEAEWEYAARELGKAVRFGNGKNEANPKEINYNGSLESGYAFIKVGINRQGAVNVGGFPPNSLGIFQMSGNVWEWCQDWYASNYYHRSDYEDPSGPPFGQYKVIRGGSWFNSGFANRITERSFSPPYKSNADIGFRVVRQINK
jgi:formylglycine-generating enzyme required for sulfatase activity